MPDRPMVALPALHLKRDLLLTAEVLHNIHCDARLRNGGFPHREFALVLHEENAVQRQRFTGLAFQAIHFQRFAGSDTILFPASFNHCIHISYPKRMG